MSKNKKRAYLSIGIALAVLLLFAYFRLRANAEAASRVPRMIPTVQVSTPKRGSISEIISFTGDIAAIQEATIFPKVNGNIEREYVDIGDRVHKGQILALIDTTIYSQNARQAKATYMQAEATLANAEVTYDRNRSLFGQNLIAKQDLDNSQTAYKVAVAQDEAAGASYRNAVTLLDYCRVASPFGGYVTRRFLDPGTYVTASSNQQGSVLFYLADISRVKIDVNIPEKDIPLLGKTVTADVRVDAYPGRVFSGRISRISEQLDLSTRTMPVEVDVDNPDALLKPGMFATVDLIMAKKDNVLILPSQVIQTDDSGDYVYELNPDSTVHKAYVRLGISHDNSHEVLSGITQNDAVLYMGQDLVQDGMKVKVSR